MNANQTNERQRRRRWRERWEDFLELLRMLVLLG